MEKWTTPEHIVCADKIKSSTKEFLQILARADEDGIYPARVSDFVSDIERWCCHMQNHLKVAATD